MRNDGEKLSQGRSCFVAAVKQMGGGKLIHILHLVAQSLYKTEAYMDNKSFQMDSKSWARVKSVYLWQWTDREYIVPCKA